MALTNTAIRALKRGAKDYRAADEKGLYLLVTPTGGPNIARPAGWSAICHWAAIAT